MGNGALGIGHWALGIGHWTWVAVSPFSPSLPLPSSLFLLPSSFFPLPSSGDRNFGRQINVLNGVKQFYTFFKGTLKSFAAGN